MVTISCLRDLSDIKGFKIIHVNCRSLYGKLNQIESQYACADVLCLTETWLNDQYDDNLLCISNRKLFRWDRINGLANGVTKYRGGGVGCYVRSELAPSTMIIPNLCITNPHIELLVVKLSPPVHKTRFLLVVYRPPTGDVDTFFQVLEDRLLSDELKEHELWIIGDFNINYQKRCDPSTRKAIDFARIYGLRQLINSPDGLWWYMH